VVPFRETKKAYDETKKERKEEEKKKLYSAEIE
jgi:hypothetical protein